MYLRAGKYSWSWCAYHILYLAVQKLEAMIEDIAGFIENNKEFFYL